MNAFQMAHHKMHEAVLGVLDKYHSVWQGSAAFTAARTQLHNGIDFVVSLQQTQGIVITGVAEDKAVLRRRLAEAAVIVAGAVAAYADKQGNHELFNAVDFTLPELMRGAEEDCETHCANILKSGTDNLAALVAEQSLTQAELTALGTQLEAFGTLVTKPRQAKAKTKSATNQMPVALLANDRTIERQLDKLMEKFRTTNPDFFNEYKVARVIVDPATHHNPPVVPPPGPTPPPA